MSLIKRIQSGDEKAMDELVRSEIPRVYNLCLRLCRNREDAADLCQDTFIKAVRNVHKFEEKAKISTWLFRITVNTWKNRVRSEKRRYFSSHFSISNPSNADEEQNEFQLEAAEPTPDEQFEKSEIHQELADSLNRLTEDEKTIIVMKDVEDYSYEEIADILNLNIGTVKSRLSRARVRLREVHLAKQGGKVA